MPPPEDHSPPDARGSAAAGMGSGSSTRSLWLRLLGKLTLSAVSLVVGLGLAEVLARFQVHLENRETLQAALSELAPPSQDRNAGLVNIVRRSSNERIIYELQPDLVERPFRHSLVSTDGRGFRLMPRAQPGPDARPITILGLGDSVMFGHGVEDHETYLALLQQVLEKQRPQARWRLINTAVPGYNTVMEVETLKAKCLDLQPDLVILHVVGNDYAPPYLVRRPEDIWNGSRCFLWDKIREVGQQRRQAQRAEVAGGAAPVLEEGEAESLFQRGKGWLRQDGPGESVLPDGAEDLFGQDAFGQALDELVSLSGSRGFDVLVFTSNELGREPAMVSQATRRGLEHLSLTPQLRAWLGSHEQRELDGESYASSPLVVGPDNLHPSALQHALACSRLAAWLQQSGWIDGQLAERGLSR